MNYFTSKWLFRFLAIMLMVTTFLPIVSNNLPPIIRSHHIWTPLWFFLLLVLAPRTYQNKAFLYTLLAGFIFVFLLMGLIWPGTNEWNRELALNELYIFSVGLSLFAYFWTYKDFNGVALVVKWTLVFIGITAVMTIISAQFDPLYARNLTGGEYTLENEITNFGGGTYGYGAALICLFPVLIYFLKYNSEIKINKAFIAGYVLLCFLALISMQFFANILLGTVLIGISLVSAKRLKFTIMIICSLGIIAILIPTGIYISIIYTLSGLFSTDSNIYFKMNELAMYLQASGEGKMNAFAARQERYPMLWQAFTEQPVLGYYSLNNTTDISLGAHLYWMNKLAIYGILGFIPFMMIFILYTKKVLKHFDRRFTPYFLIAMGGFISLGLMKALTGREFWYMVFFILPGTYFLFLKMSKQNKVQR